MTIFVGPVDNGRWRDYVCRHAMNITVLMSNRVNDARVAMAAIIESRSLSVREDDPSYPQTVASLAWQIADAMSVERAKRTGKQSIPPPPPSSKRGGK